MQRSVECKNGMMIWVDVLCIDHTNVEDKNSHVLRTRDIFSSSWSVTAWTKTHEDVDFSTSGIQQPGEYLAICEAILANYERTVLEEALGVRDRNWGEKEEEDLMLQELIRRLDVLSFGQSPWYDSDGSDDWGVSQVELRDVVLMEVRQVLGKEYWSDIRVILELAVSPTTSVVDWTEAPCRILTIQAILEILADDFAREYQHGLDI